MSDALKIGVAGLGTVGKGTLELLQAHGELIAARCGRPIQVSAVSARNRNKDRGIDLSGLRWFDDALALAADPEIEVVLELIGGSEGPAKALVEASLDRGKHVITANKVSGNIAKLLTPSGSRAMQTFRKLPTIAPKTKIAISTKVPMARPT